MRKLFQYLTICILLIGICTPAFAELLIQKNVAYTIETFIWKNDGTKLTSVAGLDSEFSYRDAAGSWSSFTDCANEAAEDGTTGDLRLVLAQAEANHEWIRVQIKSSSTGAVLRTIALRTTVGNPSLLATTDDGGPINVTGGAIDTVTTTASVTNAVVLPTGTGAGQISLSSGLVALQADQGVNVTKINSVATTSVTAVNANLGTTQPINFTGTGATAYPKSDMVDIAGSAVDAAAAQLGVNVVNWKGSAAAAMTGDAYSVVNNGTYGNSALNTAIGTRMATFTLPTNFSALSISATTGLVDITQGAADKVWLTAARALTDKAGFTISGTKTTLDSLNDITAASVLNVDVSGYSGAKVGTYIKSIFDKLPTNYLMGSAVQTDKDDDIDAILTDTAAMDSSTELRILLTGSDTAVSTYAGGAVASVSGAVGSISGVTFPANFGVFSISPTTGLVDITQTAADKAWGTTARTLTAGTNIALAKGTGITGFNDIAATDVWSAGTRTLTAGTNIALAKGTGVTGFNDLDAAGVAGGVWNAATASYGTANTYGALIETNLDAAITTRGTSTLTAANVWDLDVSGYSGTKAGTYLKGLFDKRPATGSMLDDSVWTSTKAGYLDTGISTRGTGTSTLTAANVWQTDISGYSTAGYAGTYLKGAGSAGDPWVASLPGTYTAGQAGYIIGHNIDAQVSLVGGGTAADIADAVLDELTAGHVTTGSLGETIRRIDKNTRMIR